MIPTWIYTVSVAATAMFGLVLANLAYWHGHRDGMKRLREIWEEQLGYSTPKFEEAEGGE